jgi:hypothetical protein
MKLKFQKPLSKNNPNNPYSCEELTVIVGEEFEPSDALAARLLVDFPDNFVEIKESEPEPEVKEETPSKLWNFNKKKNKGK